MKQNRKGFTLAELLIVVAIIEMLAVISILIFNNQSRKARMKIGGEYIEARL
ncbi:pilin [Bilifractor sp. HCP3S3_D3]|uniref:pilin n=1 Tax=Bilifractor sp. HCP3S3_D3 TaxID=3438907 RepID=UPI003F8ABC08